MRIRKIHAGFSPVPLSIPVNNFCLRYECLHVVSDCMCLEAVVNGKFLMYNV